jgi:hypothetical protein
MFGQEIARGKAERCDDIECAADFVVREVEEKAEKNQLPFLARLKDGLGSFIPIARSGV